MSNNRIVNIINFIRSCEPREEVDLFGTLQKEVELVQGYDLPGTWLIQYDAMIMPQYSEYLKTTLNCKQEIGIWLEIVQPLVEKAGIKWRGRFPWDWHVNPGFSESYTQEERRRLIDIFMEDFLAIFGQYPCSMGSWIFDAYTLQYAYERYGIVAACNCKDQWGTDGYTLWGGYWANAYYASKVNSYMPAQCAGGQIDVPIFRMLGSDPIYQYSVSTKGDNGQDVITLEPVYVGKEGRKYGGGDPAWVRWFFKNNFTTPNLAMSYAQAGQENPFGWQQIGKGLTDQMGVIRQMYDEGTIRVETLETSGRWFRQKHATTPATMVTVLDDWQKQGRQTVWYMNRYQRFSFFVENNEFFIRDWQIFNQDYQEDHLTVPCMTNNCCYDALPVMDGFRWRGNAFAAIRLAKKNGAAFDAVKGKLTVAEECGDDSAWLEWQTENGAKAIARACGKELRFDVSDASFCLQFIYDSTVVIDTSFEVIDGTRVEFVHKGFRYGVECLKGSITLSDKRMVIAPENGVIILRCN